MDISPGVFQTDSGIPRDFVGARFTVKTSGDYGGQVLRGVYGGVWYIKIQEII